LALKANEYPDCWIFSNDCPSPPKDSGWVSDKKKVRHFVDVFLLPQFFGEIVIWEYYRLVTSRYFTRGTNENYKIIDYLPEAEQFRFAIEGHTVTGHMSVLYIPLSPDIFLKRVLAQKSYGKPREILIGKEVDNGYPFDCRHGQNIDFIMSKVFKEGDRIFAFSHDAEFLYEIFR
jgi:hypothetical protein